MQDTASYGDLQVKKGLGWSELTTFHPIKQVSGPREVSDGRRGQEKIRRDISQDLNFEFRAFLHEANPGSS